MEIVFGSHAELYLDHNGSTPLHPEVLEACLPLLRQHWGNPSAGHPAGLAVRAAIDRARAAAAAALGAREDELVFTSGGSEANNHALKGRFPAGSRGHLVVSAVEHKSVLQSAAALERRGVEVTHVPVGASGAVRAEDVAAALRPDTRLVSLMLANNETGALQPVRAVADLCRARGVPLHVDAVAALGKVPVDVSALGCDLLSLAGHKLYAPKGVGILFVRAGTELEPLVDGCGQQRGQRGGTENACAAVGFGKALEMLAEGRLAGAVPVAALRDRLWAGLRDLAPDVRRNGEGAALPNTLNVWFPGLPGHELQAALGRRGVSVAAGSAATGACPSHVLVAMGLGERRARESVRFSLGLASTAAGVERVLTSLGEVLERRAAAGGVA